MNQNRLLNKILRSFELEPENWEAKKKNDYAIVEHKETKMIVRQNGDIFSEEKKEFCLGEWKRKNLLKLQEALNSLGSSRPLTMLNLGIQTDEKILAYLDKCLDETESWEDSDDYRLDMVHKSGLAIHGGYTPYISCPRYLVPKGFWAKRRLAKKLEKVKEVFQARKDKEVQERFSKLLKKFDRGSSTHDDE